MSETLPTIEAIAKDDRIYIYYDQSRISSHETERPILIASKILANIASMSFILVAIFGLCLLFVSLLKLIPFAAGILNVLIILVITILVLVYWRQLGKGRSLRDGLRMLARRGAARQLSTHDYCNQQSLRYLSDGHSSLEDFFSFFGVAQFALSLLVLREVELHTLWGFFIWYSVLVLDSITLTVMNLTEYVKTAPRAPEWLIACMQILILASLGSRILNDSILIYRGYDQIQGNKFKVRHRFNDYVRKSALFNVLFEGFADQDAARKEMEKRAIFVEIDYANRSTPVMRALSIEQLDAEILQDGKKIVEEARNCLAPNGKFSESFEDELTRILAGN